MSQQEQWDFDQTKEILTGIYCKHGQVIVKQLPHYSHGDLTFSVAGRSALVEIKERTQDMTKYHDIPLTCKKYCYLLNEVEDGGYNAAMYCVLLNGTDYLLFNLSSLDLNKVKMKNWKIQKEELGSDKTAIEVPTLFIPVTMALKKGKINGLDKQTKEETNER